MLINMVHPYRDLPYPPVSYISQEMVKEIKAIPDDEARFTETQVAWMHRVLENLEYLLIQARAIPGSDIGTLLERKAEFEAALELHREHLLRDEKTKNG